MKNKSFYYNPKEMKKGRTVKVADSTHIRYNQSGVIVAMRGTTIKVKFKGRIKILDTVETFNARQLEVIPNV